MSGTWQLWLGSGVIAALVAAVARLVELPKSRGEAHKAEAEADATKEKTALESLTAALKQSDRTCGECQAELRTLRLRCEELIDAVEKLVENPGGVSERQGVRAAIRDARQAL